MTVSHRQQLVRDLARLVAKYGTDEFAALLEQVTRTQLLDEIGYVVRGLQEAGAPRQPIRSRTPAASRPKRPLDRLRTSEPAAAVELTEIQAVLLGTPHFRSKLDLRALADSIGLKRELSRDRRVASRQLVDFAANLPDAARQEFIERVRAGRPSSGGAYADWAKMIMGDDRKPAEPPPKSGEGH